MKCPRGHAVGTFFGAIACGPDACVEGLKVLEPASIPAPPKQKRKNVELPIPYKEVNKSLKKTEKGLVAAGLDEELTQEAEDHVQKMKKAIGRYEARKAFLGAPDTAKLSPEEMKDYVQKKLDSLTPEAIARIEVALKLGDDDVSLKAAYEILDRGGFGKKEGGGLPGAPIIIQVTQNGVPNQDTTTTTYKPAWMTVEGKSK